MHEAGVSDYEATGWMGFFVPIGTSAETTAALATALMPLLNTPALIARVDATSSVAAVQDGPNFGRFVAAELAKWRGLAEVAGIAAD